jgi:hypothetical protein
MHYDHYVTETLPVLPDVSRTGKIKATAIRSLLGSVEPTDAAQSRVVPGKLTVAQLVRVG